MSADKGTSLVADPSPLQLTASPKAEARTVPQHPSLPTPFNGPPLRQWSLLAVGSCAAAEPVEKRGTA